eukprot:g3252.t1
MKDGCPNICFQKLSKSKATPRKDKLDFDALQAGFSPGIVGFNRQSKKCTKQSKKNPVEKSGKKSVDQKRKRKSTATPSNQHVSADASTVKKARHTSDSFSQEVIEAEFSIPSTVKKSKTSSQQDSHTPVGTTTSDKFAERLDTPSNTVAKLMRSVLGEVVQTELSKVTSSSEMVEILQSVADEMVHILPCTFSRSVEEEQKRVQKENFEKLRCGFSSQKNLSVANQRLQLQKERLEELLSEFREEEKGWEEAKEHWRTAASQVIEEFDDGTVFPLTFTLSKPYNSKTDYSVLVHNVSEEMNKKGLRPYKSAGPAFQNKNGLAKLTWYVTKKLKGEEGRKLDKTDAFDVGVEVKFDLISYVKSQDYSEIVEALADAGLLQSSIKIRKEKATGKLLCTGKAHIPLVILLNSGFNRTISSLKLDAVKMEIRNKVESGVKETIRKRVSNIAESLHVKEETIIFTLSVEVPVFSKSTSSKEEEDVLRRKEEAGKNEQIAALATLQAVEDEKEAESLSVDKTTSLYDHELLAQRARDSRALANDKIKVAKTTKLADAPANLVVFGGTSNETSKLAKKIPLSNVRALIQDAAFKCKTMDSFPLTFVIDEVLLPDTANISQLTNGIRFEIAHQGFFVWDMNVSRDSHSTTFSWIIDCRKTEKVDESNTVDKEPIEDDKNEDFKKMESSATGITNGGNAKAIAATGPAGLFGNDLKITFVDDSKEGKSKQKAKKKSKSSVTHRKKEAHAKKRAKKKSKSSATHRKKEAHANKKFMTSVASLKEQLREKQNEEIFLRKTICETVEGCNLSKTGEMCFGIPKYVSCSGADDISVCENKQSHNGCQWTYSETENGRKCGVKKGDFACCGSKLCPKLPYGVYTDSVSSKTDTKFDGIDKTVKKKKKEALELTVPQNATGPSEAYNNDLKENQLHETICALVQGCELDWTGTVCRGVPISLDCTSEKNKSVCRNKQTNNGCEWDAEAGICEGSRICPLLPHGIFDEVATGPTGLLGIDVDIDV